ncbi:MAG TPA: DUF2490 domain-containing protein [Gammaproteobacteria bacterium]|nr:DUF2490 domain-containing protein [Gammaproteobacteria bacterium]
MYIRIACFLLSLFTLSSAYATIDSFAKLWLVGAFIGPLSEENKNWKYYIEPRFAAINDKYGLSEIHMYTGIGYKIAPCFTPYMGYAYYISDSTSGVISHENVIWQQSIWDIYKSDRVSLSNRARFEERKNTQFAEWACRLREQFTLKLPFQNTKYSFAIFDELFFNLNHPLWVSNRFLAQNRLFLGIEKKLTKTSTLDIGYLNQIDLERQNRNLLTNGLYIKLHVNS